MPDKPKMQRVWTTEQITACYFHGMCRILRGQEGFEQITGTDDIARSIFPGEIDMCLVWHRTGSPRAIINLITMLARDPNVHVFRPIWWMHVFEHIKHLEHLPMRRIVRAAVLDACEKRIWNGGRGELSYQRTGDNAAYRNIVANQDLNGGNGSENILIPGGIPAYYADYSWGVFDPDFRIT
ncbi:MAG: hypothetical protein WCT24_02140 [Patescibacteria group bacterium]